MRSTNRVLNRGLLLLCGLLLAVAGAAALLAGTRPGRADLPALTAPAGTAWSRARTWATGLPEVGGVPGIVVVALAAAVLLLVLLTVFVLTRGRGRTSTVLDLRAGDGRTSADREVAEAVLAAPLDRRPDVLSARTNVYRVRGAPAIEMLVTVRRGADLSVVLAAVDGVLGDWDALAGVRVPVLVHLSDRGWLDGLRSSRRVQ
ncbi:hypothetical protein [Myceligenerans xiligouense]|uniref:Uncharacterized protein n=1 Tax=Myceligenerans xiligouense TaxID=253184 RepID=A0A3N4Z4P3_9MICO|nr:hypothetical protein [Myceligenerans xiligouense]RPF20888.1 hypothetical protein EDD34_1495 [Myceligenerans xiligouense]